MSHVEPERGGHGNTIASNTGYKKCPCCGFATIYYKGEPPQYADTVLLQRIRANLMLHKSDKPTRLLIQEIDVILLSR